MFFDDFKVTQTHSPVVQKSDYQAFGLEFNSYSRAAITAQNFKFNAGSEQEQMTDWYSTPFRKYDPSLGRFHGIDALADLYTGYTPSHFALNNPINYNDPTGLTVAPKSENQKQGAGGGTQHRHLPDGLGPNYARAGWTSLYTQTWGDITPSAGFYMAKHAIATFLERGFSSYVGDVSYKNFVTGEFYFSDGFSSVQPKKLSGGIAGGVNGASEIDIPSFGGSQGLIARTGGRNGTGGRGGSSGGGSMGMDPDYTGTGGDDIDGEYYDGGDYGEEDNHSNRLALFLLGATLSSDMAGDLFNSVINNLKYLARKDAMFGLDYSREISKASRYAKGIKVGGTVASVAGLGVTYSDWKNGSISGREASIDATFGAMGAIPHPLPVGISIIYSSGKGSLQSAGMDVWNFKAGAYGRIYNTRTGKTVGF